jgi:inositol phosphorylceramide mannosyltransferase catalytic subunit
MQSCYSSQLGSLFVSDFFRGQRIFDDFHIKIRDIEYWQYLARIYSMWLSQKAYTPIVPKKIHQIWLGSAFPNKYKKFQESWKQINPDFEYYLWTDDNVRDLGLYNIESYLATDNYGVKSDLARYEILHKFGGIYVDTDFECLKPLDARLLSCSFLSGQGFSYSPEVFNGILIAAPGDKFMELIIDNIPACPGHLSPMETLAYCGSLYVTKLLWTHHERFNNLAIMPSQYFYPWPNYKLNDSENRYQWITSESFAIHHWETSWAGKSLSKRLKEKLFNLIHSTQ